MGTDVDHDLSRQLALAQQALRSRDDFLATAAHELRTPMHALALQLEVVGRLMDRGDAARSRAEVARAQRMLQRFLRRATTLLDVARLSQEQPALDFEPFDLVPLLRDVAEDLAHDAAAHRVAVQVETPAALPVVWNRHGAEIVLSNLLSNALRYAPGRPVELRAELIAGDRVALTVSDQGPGIAPADRERLFAKFERLEHRRSTEPGFGLGLWIVGRIVVGHHGAVAIHDNPGGGTRFEVTLPRSPLTPPPAP